MTPSERYQADLMLVGTKLAALCPMDSVAAMRGFVHDGEPIPKARAGTFKGRRFTPAKQMRAERDLAYCFRSAVPERPIYRNVAIAAIFFRSSRTRVDLDNMLKTLLDAGNQAGVWVDDCQVTAQVAFVELDADRPRTVVGLLPITGSLDRTVPLKKRGRGGLLDATP